MKRASHLVGEEGFAQRRPLQAPPPSPQYYFSMTVGEPVTSAKELELIAAKAKVNVTGTIFRQHLYSIAGVKSIDRVPYEHLTEVADWIRDRYHTRAAPMMHAASRIARTVADRYAAQMLQFKQKPKHFITILGERYALSDDQDFVGDIADDMTGDESPEDEGARLIDLGGPEDPWRFVWLLNTDKQQVSVYRVTDGDLRAEGPARTFTRALARLDAKGQINRVDGNTERRLAQHFEKIADEHAARLEAWIEAGKDEFQRNVDRLVREFFDRKIAPKIKDVLEDLDEGVHPFGFEFNDKIVHWKDEAAQKRMFVVSREMEKFNLPAIDAYLRSKGLNLEAPGMDSQAAYWAMHDVIQDAYRQFGV